MSYGLGQRVRVDAREHEGHHRTPAYVKGKTGAIQTYCVEGVRAAL